MSGSGDLQPNSGLRYHTDADSPLPETINPIIDAVETNAANISSVLAGGTEQSVTLENGWTGTLSCKINDLGQVSVNGRITPGTVAKGTSIAQLPYSPKNALAFAVYDSGSGVVKTPLTISATGRIYVQASSGNELIADRTINFETLFNAS